MQKQVGFSTGCTTNSLLSGSTEFFRRSTNLRRPINRITTEYCAGLQNRSGAPGAAPVVGRARPGSPVAQPGFSGVLTGGCSPGAETGCSRKLDLSV